MMCEENRLHALDAVRAFALLAGIALHATMSFFLPLPAMDASQSTTLGVLFYVIHIFRMSLFFLIAGFFAHRVFHRRGWRTFARDRLRRIAIPMLVGWVILTPLLGAIVIWGLIRTFGAESAEGTETPDMGFPLTHLWFLYYLCIFYVGFLILRAMFVGLLDRQEKIRQLADRVLSTLIRLPATPVLLGLPLALVFYSDEWWPAWFGIPTPDYGLTPQLPAVIAYGGAFALGWILDRQRDLLHCLRDQAFVHLPIAVILTVASLALIGLTPTLSDPFVGSPDWHKTVYTVLYTSAIWYWSFGIIGAALRFLAQPSVRWRYLADASYWMYLAHLPLVFFLQVILAQLPIHWSIKYPLILVITTALLLISYHAFVRYTRIGKVLNGKILPRASLI